MHGLSPVSRGVATKLSPRRANVFVFQTGGPGPLTGRAASTQREITPHRPVALWRLCRRGRRPEHLDKIARGDRNKDYTVQVQCAQDPAISSGEKMQNAIQTREHQFKSIVTYKDSKRMELSSATQAPQRRPALAGLFCVSFASR